MKTRLRTGEWPGELSNVFRSEVIDVLLEKGGAAVATHGDQLGAIDYFDVRGDTAFRGSIAIGVDDPEGCRGDGAVVRQSWIAADSDQAPQVRVPIRGPAQPNDRNESAGVISIVDDERIIARVSDHPQVRLTDTVPSL